MKNWEKADLEVVELCATAFGPQNLNKPDSDKTAVRNEDGVLLGWKQQFGEGGASSGDQSDPA